MIKRIILLIFGVVLIISSNVFADDVSIDGSGNVKTGVSNANAELEVTGASGEGGIVGSASGTGASGVYGINTSNSDYGILGYSGYGVYGNSSTWAGYFQGNAMVTGNLTVDGSVSGPNIGDITGVTAGTGLSGGGTSGSVTLNVNTTTIQQRVTGTCVAGSSISIVNGDGTVACEIDDVGITNETDPKIGGNSLNYIPKWNGSALVSGSIFDNGNVGIGTSTPSRKLDINGNMSVNGFESHTPALGGIAVWGDSADNFGVYGESIDGRGVYGYSINGIGLVGESPYSKAGHFEQSGILTSNTTQPVFDVYRNMTIGSYDATGAILRVEDNTNSSGNLIEVVKQNSTKMIINNFGDVGIGTSSPSGALEVARDQFTPIIRLTGYRVDAGSPVFFMGRRARGTEALPSAVQADDILASFAGTGYGTSDWPSNPTTRGRMDITAAENWTDTAQGAYIAFRTTPTGTINSLEKMRITDAGKVGIGTTNPQSTLQVSGYTQLALTSGAPPSADCDSASERGRMKVDNVAGRLYICVDSGWVWK